jgi:hypothetical protein
MNAHGAIRDVFACIAKEVGFHAIQEQLFVLPFSHFKHPNVALTMPFQRMGFAYFVDIIIVDPTCVELPS